MATAGRETEAPAETRTDEPDEDRAEPATDERAGDETDRTDEPPPPTAAQLEEAVPVGEGERVPRVLHGRFAAVAAVLAFVLACYQVAHGVGWITLSTPIQHRAIHLWFAVILVYLWYGLSRKNPGRRPTVLDGLAIVGVTVPCVYIIRQAPEILTVGGAFPPDAAVPLGLLLLAVALEATRRVLGWSMTIMALLLIAYALFGDELPGDLGIRGFSLDGVVNDLYYSDRGLFGPLMGLSAGVIAAFLIFGAVLYQTGGGETFVKIARLVTGASRGGPAKVSTVSSALFGIASGSAVANVIVDGVFNIPLMRKSGYSKRLAAAIEAVASTGGQIVPPFMGASAFVLAEFVGVPYTTVALAGIIPALLYYAALYTAIHLHAVKHGISGIPRRQLPRFVTIVPDVIKLLVPIALLIWLLYKGYSPETSVLYALGVVIGIHLVIGLVRRTFLGNVMDVVRGFTDGGKSVAVLAVLILAASIVVREIDLTALGVKLSASIAGLAESSLAAALLVAMITTIVLGMGVPTTASYVIAAAVVVPAVIDAGVNPLAANLFVLYFAVMSAITPPVAPAVFAAASLARTGWGGVAKEAMRLSLPVYLVPFLFVLSPSLLLEGSAVDTVYRLVVSAIGIVAIAAGLVGQLVGPLGAVRRLVLIAGGLLLIYPHVWAAVVGVLVIAVVAATSWRDRGLNPDPLPVTV